MDLTEAAHMARSLMAEHGVGRIRFEFDRSKKRLGCTHFVNVNEIWIADKITLSSFYVARSDEALIRNTILHEIARARAGFTRGDAHGPNWIREAKALGIEPKRCGAGTTGVEAAWKPHCPTCDWTATGGFHRAPLKPRQHAKCNTIVDWHKNGVKVHWTEMPARYVEAYVKISSRRLLTSQR